MNSLHVHMPLLLQLFFASVTVNVGVKYLERKHGMNYLAVTHTCWIITSVVVVAIVMSMRFFGFAGGMLTITREQWQVFAPTALLLSIKTFALLHAWHYVTEATFLFSYLLDDLGYAADTAEAEAVLQGDYPLDDIDPYAAEYLRQCQHIQPPPGIRDWDGTITTESHVQGVKKLKERTAPGPSGITPAHYKASLHVPGLVALDSALRNFCSRSGYSLRRCRRATTCILEKSPGNHHVEDSRFIVCSEIDWNLNNKELGRQLKASASARERGISAEQHGAQSGKSASEQALCGG